MALDGIFLRHIKSEIEKEALGARVSQIYQPNREELVFGLRTFSGNKKLLLSARANSPRVNFCSSTPENPAQPPMFCMLLRKRIGGGKLVKLRQNGCDRVLMLDFECVNELGDTVMITVVCEIMGMYSNIIIVDSNGVIIDSLKRVDLTMSSKRLVLPNIKYELPESQNKLNLLKCSVLDVCTAVKNLDTEMPLNKALLRTIEGVSPIVCREIEYKVMEGATNRIEGVLFDRLAVEIEKLKSVCSDCSGKPVVVYREDGKPMDFCFMNVEQYGDFAKVESKESFSDLLDGFYEARDSRDRMRVKSQSLTKLLNNTLERLARKIAKQKSELERCADREHLRICGDLLQANIYRIERGAEYVDVENFYDENNAILRIKLNPAISPSANAQKYYKDYRKAKNAEIMLKEQLEKEHEYNICQYKKMQEFVENIAHQIKTPLSVMTMKLEMLQDMLNDITGFHTSFEYDMSNIVPKDIKYCLISIAKEAITNAVKHSNGDQLSILIREHPGFYQLTIHDNGTDIHLTDTPGIGLTNIRERVQSLSGTLQITTNSGFRLFVSIPKHTQKGDRTA